jgi:hypothetical protein
LAPSAAWADDDSNGSTESARQPPGSSWSDLRDDIVNSLWNSRFRFSRIPARDDRRFVVVFRAGSDRANRWDLGVRPYAFIVADLNAELAGFLWINSVVVLGPRLGVGVGL